MSHVRLPIAAKSATALAGAWLVAALGLAAPAHAEAPRWQLSVTPVPTHLSPGGEGQIVLLAWNVGGEGAGAPVTVADELPQGLEATSVHTRTTFDGNGLPETMSCSVTPEPTCTWSKATAPFGESITPDGFLELNIKVKVQGPPRTVVDEARVEGGEAAGATISQPLGVSGEAVPFGVERYDLRPENSDGSVDTQSGSHPFQMISTLGLNSTFEAGVLKPVAMPRNLDITLPPGLLGDPQAIPQCSVEQFTTPRLETNYCPPESAVGIVLVTVREPAGKIGNPTEPITTLSPLFNLTPAPGEPARLGFMGAVVPVVLDTAVRSGGDYGVTVSSSNVPETAEVLATRVMVWGVPGDPRHNAARGWGCLRPSQANALGGCPAPATSQSFLTLPTSCGEPLESAVAADSWATPGKATQVAPPAFFTLGDETGKPLVLNGCDRLPFSPTFALGPETQAASEPTGLKSEVHVPQATTLSPEGLAEADVMDTTVALPEGVQLSPSAATGLEACQEGEPGGVGFTGFKELGAGSPTATFTDALPPEWEAGAGFCPDGAKVGVVHIKTPLLSHELEGGVYLAEQNANPFGSLVALYIVAQDKADGVLVKLAGDVHLDERTGRVVTSFEHTPEVPFETLVLEFFGGAQGPVSTPPYCGVYSTTASFAPWSGGQEAQSASSFPITSGPDGSPCRDPQPFSPLLIAGSASIQAGAFTPLSTTFSREDGNQNLSVVQLHMPEGLLGKLAAVTPCGEPQAALGACGPESEIGHTTVSVGLGEHPYTIPGGKVFITGPYQGAPFGLSIAAPAKAGPFDLGSGPCDCVVVRAKVEIDRYTSALTVTSDPLPRMLDGIPLQLKRANVTVDRPGFTFNPTNCSALEIAGTFTGEQGASAQASVPFEIANCATLPFRPSLSASTQASTSKADGASLAVRVTQKQGEANIHTVDLELPKSLPSRLSTLQKACTEAQFNADPAGCPPGSVIGMGTAHTPVLQSPLTGPAYLVSHGGAAFPDVELVLQVDERGGEFEIVLDGKTQIKKGITYSHFETVPDAPISSFEALLPEGPHSVLSTEDPGRTKLCALSLAMPTTIVGQNGSQITQSTKIAVSGCRPVTIAMSKLSGRHATLTFNLTTRGVVTITGFGLKRYRSAMSAGRHQVNVALSRAGLSMRTHHSKIRIKVALRSGSSSSSSTTQLTL